MEGRTFYYADYLLKGSVPTSRVADFLGRIMSGEPLTPLPLDNLETGIFRERTFRTGIWEQTHYGNSMASQISPDMPEWSPAEPGTLTAVFAANSFRYQADQIIFGEGLLVVSGLATIPGRSGSCSHLSAGAQPIATELTLTRQGEGEDYMTVAQLRHEPISPEAANDVAEHHASAASMAS